MGDDQVYSWRDPITEDEMDMTVMSVNPRIAVGARDDLGA